MSNIKLVLTDVDGCMTDGTVFYMPNGDKIKRFNLYDGRAIQLLKENGMKSGIISSDNSIATQKRATDLGMDYICVGKKDKLGVLYEIIESEDISLESVAYMGDDIQDLDVLSKVGFSCAPCNAMQIVKEKVDYVTQKKGGEGAFREFIEKVIELEEKK